MTKKEALKPPPLLLMFERILTDSGMFIDSKDWRDLRYSYHVDWVAPLLELGAIHETSVEVVSHDNGKGIKYRIFGYNPTPAGVTWWAEERTKHEEKDRPVEVNLLSEPYGDRDPVIDGKGIGTPIQIWWEPHRNAAIKGIRDGLFKLEKYYWGHPSFWHNNDSVTVSLTPKGFEYFDSLPRLLLECA